MRALQVVRFVRWSAAVLAAVVVGLALAGGVEAGTVIRFGHTGLPDSVHHAGALKFAERVNEALKGQVEVRVFHSSQLGSDEQMLKGVKMGTPEMFLPSTVMSSGEQKFGVFEMPYLIVSRAHMKKVSEHPEVIKSLFGPLPAKGMRALAFWENGFRHVTTNSKPVLKPEDLKGIKLRVPGGVWRVKMFKSYGANPTPLAYAELYSALQAGVMDAQENPLQAIYGGKLHEVQKFLSMTGHVYAPTYPTISEETWQKLTTEQQDTIARIARETGDYSRAEGERMDRDYIGKVAPPLKVNEVDKELFIKASAAIYEDFGKEVKGGAELVKLVQSLR